MTPELGSRPEAPEKLSSGCSLQNFWIKILFLVLIFINLPEKDIKVEPMSAVSVEER